MENEEKRVESHLYQATGTRQNLLVSGFRAGNEHWVKDKKSRIQNILRKPSEIYFR